MWTKNFIFIENKLSEKRIKQDTKTAANPWFHWKILEFAAVSLYLPE